MGRLAPISVRELIRKLREFGWEGPYHKGKHPHMVQNGRRLKIPNPHGTDISGDLIERHSAECGNDSGRVERPIAIRS